MCACMVVGAVAACGQRKGVAWWLGPMKRGAATAVAGGGGGWRISAGDGENVTEWHGFNFMKFQCHVADITNNSGIFLINIFIVALIQLTL